MIQNPDNMMWNQSEFRTYASERKERNMHKGEKNMMKNKMKQKFVLQKNLI